LRTGRGQLKGLQKVVKNPTSKNFSAGWVLSN